MNRARRGIVAVGAARIEVSILEHEMNRARHTVELQHLVVRHFWYKPERQVVRAVQRFHFLDMIKIAQDFETSPLPKRCCPDALELNRPEIPYTKSNEEPQIVSSPLGSYPSGRLRSCTTWFVLED